jgi:hypothetical protein
VVDEVAFLRDGRLVLHVPVGELEAKGLALSHEGLEAFVESRSVGPDAPAAKRKRKKKTA